MIPAVQISDSDYFGRPRSAFRRGGSSRPLEVWVDFESLEPSEHLDHLLGFAHHDLIDLYASRPVEGANLADLLIHDGQAGARVDTNDGYSLHAGGRVDTYKALTSRWLPNGTVADREALLSSALLGTVADNSPADAYVTGAELLWTNMRRSNAMSVLNALSIIGLYLRSTDDFMVSMNPAHLQYNRGLFYWLLARELVPSWGPTWRKLVPDTVEDSSRYLNGLAHALIVRVDQALRARDRVHLELKLPQDNDSADEVLFALDGLLVSLDACFDIIARVLNSHYDLGKDTAARWRSAEWVRKLIAAVPRLHDTVCAKSPFADSVALIGALRSSLHGVPSQTIAYSSGSIRDIENLLVAPPEQQERIAEIVQRRGGGCNWGMRPDLDDLIFVEINSFVEALTRLSLEVIEHALSAVCGADAEVDRAGDWGDTPEVRNKLRSLSGTVGWNGPSRGSNW